MYLTIDSYSFDSSTPPPNSELQSRSFYDSDQSEEFFDKNCGIWLTLSAQFIVGAKFRVVAALIRTGKQTQKKSYCASEPCGEEYKTSGMHWRVLDDEEAAAY